MLRTKSIAKIVSDEYASRRAAWLRKFGREEDGGLIVFTLILLVIMLVIGGMAVDFMRFESRRALLQSVADRSVLAAADLDQTMDQKDVVVQYFEKAGFGGAIQGEPMVSDRNGNVSVSVNSAIDVDTFYLRFIGIDQLRAPAYSEAREGVGQVEISLVLDISGSMDKIVSGASLPPKTARSCPAPVGSSYHNSTNLARVSRINLLREAACGFVYDIVNDDTAGQVTMSLVAYTSQVALSPELYNALKTTSPVIAGLGGSTAIITPPSGDDDDEMDDYIANVVGNPNVAWRNPSRCVEFEYSDYKGGGAPRSDGQNDEQEEFGTTFFANKTYEQSQSFQYNVGGLYDRGGNGDSNSGTTRSTKMDSPMCPSEEFEGILPVSEDEDELRRRISLLEPRGGTAIFTGAKWGISLLDPSMRTIIEDVDTVASEHQGVRPVDYITEDGSLGGAPAYKFMVLITDGQNSPVARTNPVVDRGSQIRRLLDTYPTQHMTWVRGRRNDQLNSEQRQLKGILENLRPPGPNNNDPFAGGFNNIIDTEVETAAYADRLLKGMCRAAKARDIVVYTIAAGATSNGETLMSYCASEPKAIHYRRTSGADLDNILAAVAEQITDLRLTQ